MLNVNITGQNISVSGDTAVSDSVKYLKIKFTYSAEWNIFTKTAVFRNASLSEPVCLLLSRENEVSENTFYVPFEVIKAPEFSVCVFGENEDSLITTEELSVIVHQSGYAEGVTPCEPTPDIYQQLIATSDATYAVALSVREDADSGVFKGDKGDKGDKGEQGIQGVKGDDGDTPTIDQTYSATSTNAQSGTAVAQAIASIPTPSSNMEWVTLKEITTTENVHSVTIPIDGHLEYNNCKGFWLSVKSPEGVTVQSEYNYLLKVYYDFDGVTKIISTTVAGNGGTNRTLCEHFTLPVGDLFLQFMSGNTSYSGNLYSPINNSLLSSYKPRQFIVVLNAAGNIGFPAGVIMTVKGLKEVTE